MNTRPARIEDIDTIVEMFQSSFVENEMDKIAGEFDKNRAIDVLTKAIEENNCIFPVVEKNNKIVGTALFVLAPALFSPKCTIANGVKFHIIKEERGNGLGKMLLKLVCGLAEEKNVKIISITTLRDRPSLAKLCLNNGFRLLESSYIRSL